MMAISSMTRGAFWPTLVGAAVCLAGCATHPATRASAQVCVDRADANRRDCFQGCEGDFEKAFVGCYGRNACTGRCETQQVTCQAGPLHDLEFCGEAAENPHSCQGQLRAHRGACAGRPDRMACEEDARRGAAGCWYACQRTHGPVLERCAVAFKTCLDGCVGR